MNSLHSLQPQAVWQWFADICAIPHPTYQEAALAEMIVARAKGKGLVVQQDEKAIFISASQRRVRAWPISPA